MATTGVQGQRRGRGFRSAGSLVEKRVRDAGQARGFAVMRLLTHWAEIVGEDLAKVSRPAKVAHGKGFGATLTVLCTGSAAPMVQMQAPRMIQKINACYGYAAISHVRVVQTAPDGFAEPRAEHRAEPPRDPTLAGRAQSAVADVTDPGLRDALARLGRNVLSRHL